MGTFHILLGHECKVTVQITRISFVNVNVCLTSHIIMLLCAQCQACNVATCATSEKNPWAYFPPVMKGFLLFFLKYLWPLFSCGMICDWGAFP